MNTSKMGPITRQAYNYIKKESSLNSPEEILAFLKKQTNFKTLSKQLRETMISAEVGDENLSNDVFINELFLLLEKQGFKEELNSENRKRTISRWLNDGDDSVDYISDRKDVIAICFALNLDADSATELLNKLGFSGFNVRDAEDATYLYCILHKRSLKDAHRILKQYYENAVIPSETLESTDDTDSLERTLYGTNWEDDDSFINSFLLPKRSAFFGYSSTALREYYYIKNRAFLLLLLEYREDINIEEHLKTSLSKLPESHPLFSLSNTALEGNISDVITGLTQFVNNNRDLSSQECVSRFLAENKIITTESFYKNTIDSIIKSAKDNEYLFTSIIQIESNHTKKDKNTYKKLSYDEIDEIKKTVLPPKATTLRQQRAAAIISLLKDGVPENVIVDAKGKNYGVFGDCLVYKNTSYVLSKKTQSAISLYLTCKGIGRIRPKNDSVLKDTVLKYFPDDKQIAKFEKDYYSIISDSPYIKSIQNTPSIIPKDSDLSLASENPVQIAPGTDNLNNNTTKDFGQSLPITEFTSDEKAKPSFNSIAYAISTTAAGNSAKEARIQRNTKWELKSGSLLAVKHDKTNTAENPTLNVNGTGAKPIVYNNAVIRTDNLHFAAFADRTIVYIYNGSQWVWVGWSLNRNNNYIRKAIILMYFIAYAFELSKYLPSSSYQSSLFGDMDFYRFIGDDMDPGLNQLLKRCRLWPLYPANQFDWLVLKSMYILSREWVPDNDEFPLDFFNQVLSFSFVK